MNSRRSLCAYQPAAKRQSFEGASFSFKPPLASDLGGILKTSTATYFPNIGNSFRGIIFVGVEAHNIMGNTIELSAANSELDKIKAHYQKTRADGIVFDLNRFNLDRTILAQLSDWQNSGIELALCNLSDRTDQTYLNGINVFSFPNALEQAIEIVRAVESDLSKDLDLNTIEIYQRPSLYPDVHFLRIVNPISASEFNTNWLEGLREDLGRVFFEPRRLKLIWDLEFPANDLFSAQLIAHAVQRFGSHLVACTHDQETLAKSLREKGLTCLYSRKNAVNILGSRNSASHITAPKQFGWSYLRPPSWNTALNCYHLALSEPWQPKVKKNKGLKRAGPFLDAEVAAITKVSSKQLKFVVELDPDQISSRHLKLIFEKLVAKVASKGGIVAVLVNTPAQKELLLKKLRAENKHSEKVSRNLADRFESLVFFNPDQANEALKSHIFVPQPENGWTLFSRPRLEPSFPKLLVSEVISKIDRKDQSLSLGQELLASLNCIEDDSLAQELLASLTCITKSEADHFILNLKGHTVSATAKASLYTANNRFSSRGKSFFITSEVESVRHQLREYRLIDEQHGARMNVFRKEGQARSALELGLPRPVTWWDNFDFWSIPDLPNTLRLRYGDKDELLKHSSILRLHRVNFDERRNFLDHFTDAIFSFARKGLSLVLLLPILNQDNFFTDNFTERLASCAKTLKEHPDISSELYIVTGADSNTVDLHLFENKFQECGPGVGYVYQKVADVIAKIRYRNAKAEAYEVP